jgi:hypothetical protein
MNYKAALLSIADLVLIAFRPLSSMFDTSVFETN